MARIYGRQGSCAVPENDFGCAFDREHRAAVLGAQGGGVAATGFEGQLRGRGPGRVFDLVFGRGVQNGPIGSVGDRGGRAGRTGPRRNLQQSVGVRAVAGEDVLGGRELGQGQAAFGEGACLVEADDVHAAECFQDAGGAGQHAVAGQASGGG